MRIKFVVASLLNKKSADEMLKNGIVVLIKSNWSFPLVLAKKKGGSERLCGDCRSLNDRTFKDVYPIPQIDDILDHLGEAFWFSSLI